jgi:cytochrome c-type biogenesis protein CcsB
MAFIKSQNLENALLYFAVASYLLATLFYWAGFLTKNAVTPRYPVKLTVCGLLGNTLAIVVRLYKAGSFSIVDNTDFLLSFTWFAVFTGLLVIWRYRLKIIGIVLLSMVFALLVYVLATLEPVTAPLSFYGGDWLIGYLLTTAMSYGIFAVAFAVGVIYLMKDYLSKTNPRGILTQGLPALELLEELSYKIICYGFPIFSLSIAFGAVWANNLQGQYWDWTPKETWSFISWFAYVAYFHSRRLHGWRGTRSAWMAVMSFMAILFTFFGVSYFLPGQI